MVAALQYHPSFNDASQHWQKFRDIMEGGRPFVEKYIQRLSARESVDDFKDRKCVSYCPAHAKAAIIDIKNSIYQRMCDIVRTGGPVSYQAAVQKGVDISGRSMNGFIGYEIIQELLFMAKIGVYIDKAPIAEQATKADTVGIQPYLYAYKAEDILNWDTQATALLLKDSLYVIDEETGLTKELQDRYRHFRLRSDTSGRTYVEVSLYKDVSLSQDALIEPPIILNLSRIPFVCFEISQSLLTDIVDYQIALTNIASSDIAYIMKANYPFLTRQYSVQEKFLEAQDQFQENAEGILVAKEPAIDTGVSHGIKYPMGTERPDFINPSSEPLTASMAKQESMQHDIRSLINLSLSNIEPRRASAESKNMDMRGKEEGLACVGQVLEHGESQIGSVWCEYEKVKDDIHIRYPVNYSQKTDAERQAEAKDLLAIIPQVQSLTYQKEVLKRVTNVTISTYVPQNIMLKINKEIDALKVVINDPTIVTQDIADGLVGNDLASVIRGYPEGEADVARKDHAERLALIAKSQSTGLGKKNTSSDPNNAAARGVRDLSNDPSNNNNLKNTNGKTK